MIVSKLMEVFPYNSEKFQIIQKQLYLNVFVVSAI